MTNIFSIPKHRNHVSIFVSLSMGKGILIYKQCLLVTSCNQALDHYVEWESVPDPGLS